MKYEGGKVSQNGSVCCVPCDGIEPPISTGHVIQISQTARPGYDGVPTAVF
jgi:hypothetical protein